MWYLLLTLLASGEYISNGVYASQAACIAAGVVGDRCVTVELKMIELPKNDPITVTVLPTEE